MKKISIYLVFMLVILFAGIVQADPYPGPHMSVQYSTLAWDPATWADGVNLYFSQVTGNYTGANVIKVDAKKATTYNFVTNMPLVKTTFFAIATAYTNAGAESGPSNEVSWTWDPTIPNPPTGLLKR